MNFSLYPQDESDEFKVVFADTQPQTIEEVNYNRQDVVQEPIGVDAAFVTTLVDVVFDNLDLFEPMNQVITQIGIPWRNVIGTHDLDFSADTKWNVRGAYYRLYGLSWHAFTWGSAHFVAVDDIRWIVDGEDRYYRTGLGDEQMAFIEKFALWEKTTRIPLIIVAPDQVKAGIIIQTPIDLTALYPTLIDLAGLEKKDRLDDTSIMPLFSNADVDFPPTLMTYLKGNHAIRKNQWRYIKYIDGSKELYDLSNDPHEWNNLAGDSNFRGILDELRTYIPTEMLIKFLITKDS